MNTLNSLGWIILLLFAWTLGAFIFGIIMIIIGTFMDIFLLTENQECADMAPIVSFILYILMTAIILIKL